MKPTEDEAAIREIENRARRAGWDFEVLQGSAAGDRSLILARPSDDAMAELYANGRFAVQFGVDMDEMRSLLTGEQTEDMGDDELVRVARYHLKPQVDRYKRRLMEMGLTQGEDATEDYYAITFETRLDLTESDQAMKQLTQLLDGIRSVR